MAVVDAKGVTEIDVSRRQIKSLAGIEAFTDLKELDCGNNQLTVLDVSKNINLQHLDFGRNQLTVLDVSKNINLVDLACYGNQLTVLDVSKNVDLLYFWCYNNPIKTICVADITKANTSTTTKDTFGNFYWQKDPTATYSLCK